jgi:hypothetical protein
MRSRKPIAAMAGAGLARACASDPRYPGSRVASRAARIGNRAGCRFFHREQRPARDRPRDACVRELRHEAERTTATGDMRRTNEGTPLPRRSLPRRFARGRFRPRSMKAGPPGRRTTPRPRSRRGEGERVLGAAGSRSSRVRELARDGAAREPMGRAEGSAGLNGHRPTSRGTRWRASDCGDRPAESSPRQRAAPGPSGSRPVAPCSYCSDLPENTGEHVRTVHASVGPSAIRTRAATVRSNARTAIEVHRTDTTEDCRSMERASSTESATCRAPPSHVEHSITRSAAS